MNAPQEIPNLPPELVMEILSWLPVKTLMQFMCVSKSWKSLIINDPTFAKLHLKRSPKNTHILLSYIDYENEDFSFISCSLCRLLEDPPSMIDKDTCYRLKGNYIIIGSCNGLYCLGNYCEIGLIYEFCVKLWNPVTRLSSEKSPTFQMNLRSLEFSSSGKMNCGFSYDDSCDTYKVVVVLWDCTEQKMETWVHCIGEIDWRKILSDLDSPLLLDQRDGQFVGGCVNWLALDKLKGPNYEWDDINITLQNLVIASFDMRNEVYTYMSLPEGVSEVPYDEPYLGVLGNHMCFFHDHERTHFVVWKMREYGVRDSWAQLVRVSYAHLQCDDFLFRPYPMCLSEDGDLLFLTCNDEVVWYNQRDHSVKHIKLPDKKYWLCVDGYIQSLVSPFQN